MENFGLRKMDVQQVIVDFDATFSNQNQFGLNAKEAALDIFCAQDLFMKIHPVRIFNCKHNRKVFNSTAGNLIVAAGFKFTVETNDVKRSALESNW